MNKVYGSLAIIVLFLTACSETPVTVQVPTGMQLGWKSLPHRVAATEITASFSDTTPMLRAQNDGGDFGTIDNPRVQYDTVTFAHPGLVVEEVSATLVIDPTADPTGYDAFLSSTGLLLPVSFSDSHDIAVFIRGFRIDTNLYDTPPNFEQKEELPYNPSLGYTTGGFAIGSTDPVKTEDGWQVQAYARNRLAIADRDDMNQAIPEAQTWMRVDFLVIGLPSDVHLSRADAGYLLSYPEFGSQTDHPHASNEKQAIEFEPKTNLSVLGFGIQSFDLSINVDGLHDPGCSVLNEEVNFWGQEVSGPGRYLREFTARLTDITPKEDGRVEGMFDLHISNSSAMNEVGNICSALSGRALLLRADSPDQPTVSTRRMDMESGVMREAPLNE